MHKPSAANPTHVRTIRFVNLHMSPKLPLSRKLLLARVTSQCVLCAVKDDVRLQPTQLPKRLSTNMARVWAGSASFSTALNW